MLAHEDSGRGAPTVLFVHAFPMDRRMWRRQIDAVVAAGGRSIAADLRGFGASSGFPDARSIEDHVADLVALLDARQVERAVVVGLSMGGYIAMSLARLHPQRVAGLLLADTKAGPDNDEAKQGRAANIERARREGVVAVFDAMVPKVLPPDVDHAVLEELRGLAAAQPPTGVIAALAMMRDRPDATEALARVQAPTTIVVGSADGATPPAEAEKIARVVPGAELVTIEGAGHFTNVERPDAFNRALLQLLARV